MSIENSVFIPTKESLVFPQIPANFPEKYYERVAEYVDFFILSALSTTLRKQMDRKNVSDTDPVRFWQSELRYHSHEGFILPEENNMADVRENRFSVSAKSIVGTSHIGQCLGGVMVNEKTREAVAFHVWPLSNWKGKEAFRYAVGYWKALKELVPIEATRFDFAASAGGWRWSSEIDNHRNSGESESHRIMFEAFKHVFGNSIKFSRWTTAQIQYDPNRNEVYDPVRQRILPKEGATDYWVDLWLEQYSLEYPNVAYTKDAL